MFNKISTWNKWDLHIHTRASRVRKGSSEYFGEGLSFTDKEIVDFVDNIMYDGGPTLIAITDHDFFDVEQFKKIKNTIYSKSIKEKRDLNVLPGVEFDIKFKLSKSGKIFDSFDNEDESIDSDRIHCVIVFNDDLSSTQDAIYSKICNVTNRFYPHDDSPVYINELIQALVEAKLEFIIIPHFDKNRGIEECLPDTLPNMKEQKTNWILCDYFPLLDGKQSDFINGKLQYIFETISKHLNGHSIPIILTSDNHDYRNYKTSFDSHEKDLSYYKSLPTFKGLKMCISDFSQRVSQRYSEIRNPYISMVEIIDKKSGDTKKIDFSNSLNCVIGGRSSELNLFDEKKRNVEKTMQFDGKYYRFDTYFEDVEVKYYKDKNCVKSKTRKVAIEIMDTHKTPDEKIKAAETNNIDIYEFDVNDFKKIYKKVMKEKFETPKLLSKESFIKYTKKLAVNLKNEEFSIDEITSNYFKKVNN